MDEKQHEEMNNEEAQAEKEKLDDLDVPEGEVEDVKGGGIDFGGRPEH